MKQNSFGLKEVADVELYPVGKVKIVAGKPTPDDGVIASYTFDSLKVSNIEVASEETSARGGKGNPELISWSYGKTVNLTMTDALLSMETMDLMFGGEEAADNESTTLTIDADTFPGTYCVVGTTAIRSYATGDDELFYFVIPKAQFTVGGTFTMEAEGDPSTFDMNCKALAGELVVGDSTKKDVLIEFCRPGQTIGENSSLGAFGENMLSALTLPINSSESIYVPNAKGVITSAVDTAGDGKVGVEKTGNNYFKITGLAAVDSSTITFTDGGRTSNNTKTVTVKVSAS